MRILITGAAGFAGPHLISELVSHGHTCVATDLHLSDPIPHAEANVEADIRDREALRAVIERAQPEACIHMAGITSVSDGVTDPDLMLSVNVRGTMNLLELLRHHTPAVRLLAISTAHVYGVGAPNSHFSEDSPLRPLSMYAVSKAAADLATLAYAHTHDLPAMVARPNNHTGPGQQPRFVVGAFAKQVADIMTGRIPPEMHVGNLDSERDIMDVQDVVRAYRLLIENGQPGHAYNIGSENRLRIGDMLDTLCRLADVSPAIHTDPDRMRPTDWSPLLDTTRLTETTGWHPTVPFDLTLQNMLNDFSR